MKKTIKILFTLLLLIFVAVTLCSCTMIDQMRETQGWFKGEDIYYKEKTYVLFPYTECLRADFENGINISVAEEDMPLLIANLDLGLYSVSEDGVFIMDLDGQYYCREDKYTEYLKLAKEAKAENYCYEFEYIGPEGDVTTDYYVLSEKEEDALLSVISDENLSDDIEDVNMLYDHQLLIEGASEDLMFRMEYAVVYEVKSSYYLLLLNVDPNEFDMDEHVIEDGGNFYKVPYDLNDTFEDMLEMYKEGQYSVEEQYENDYYYYY